jgi:hypothetical protein
MMAPNIYSGINESTTPSVLSNQLGGILQPDGAVESELTIALNLEGNCGYKLVWETVYEKNGSKQSWVDAQTGAVLKTIDTYAHNIAPTVNYMPQDMDDTFEGGVHSLVSAAGIAVLHPAALPRSEHSVHWSSRPTTTPTLMRLGQRHRQRLVFTSPIL